MNESNKPTTTGRPRTVRLTTVLAAAVLIAAAVFGFAATVGAKGNGNSIRVDVAEDASKFFFEGDSTIAEGELAGFPAYGDGFITQGFIYEEGTLSVDDPGIECEFDADGLPTSCTPLYEPIGTWTCWGHHVGDGAATAEGEYVVATTQLFEFELNGKSHTIVTNGFESAGVNVTDTRAITGGTGRYSKARGTQTQLSYGLHPEVFNIRLTETLNWKK
jgi:hypothetical protein